MNFAPGYTRSSRSANRADPRLLSQNRHAHRGSQPRSARAALLWPRPCAMQSPCAGSNLLVYARCLCVSVSSTSSWSGCLAGWRCWREPTPRMMRRSSCCGTKSRCCCVRSAARGRTGLTVPCSPSWHGCCPGACGCTESTTWSASSAVLVALCPSRRLGVCAHRVKQQAAAGRAVDLGAARIGSASHARRSPLHAQVPRATPAQGQPQDVLPHCVAADPGTIRGSGSTAATRGATSAAN